MWRALLVASVLAASPAHALDYGRAPDPLVRLDSHEAGQSPGHFLAFSVFRGELETYRAVVIYPDGFRFRGFDALGPAGTAVGALTLDFDGDGAADQAVPLRSLTPASAYADVIPDGRFSPGLEPVLRHVDAAAFVLRLPFGGDADAGTLVARFDARVSLALFAGLIANPRVPGTYTVTAALVSVDPDTDGADDGAGAAPVTLAFETSVAIEAPPVVPFAALCIDKADIADDRFAVHGRYVPGPGSDGTRFPADAVTVTFAGFQQAIPGAAFSALGQGVQFLGRGPGIKRLQIVHDGRFQLDARDVDLRGVARTGVPFALQIGDDRGEAALDFDRNGHLRSRGAPGCGE
jgi:hypothetical protein